MPQVITLGEVLADLVPEGTGYALRPGGAPSNVAVNLARMGIRSGIIAKLGVDFIGNFLISFLRSNKVNVSNISRTNLSKTGLVFVSIDPKGGQGFSFYGEPSADKFLSTGDINQKYIRSCSIFHYGSISFMHPVSAGATLKAVKAARKYGKLVSFDPNVRLNLWPARHNEAKKQINSCFKYADIIKISDGELKFLFNAAPSATSLGKIFRYGQLVFVSAGAAGSYVYYRGFFAHVPAHRARVVDTTGAGDAYMAGVLACIININKRLDLDREELLKIASFANSCGAKAVARKGAV
jgi:fructokinase